MTKSFIYSKPFSVDPRHERMKNYNEADRAIYKDIHDDFKLIKTVCSCGLYKTPKQVVAHDSF